MNPSAANKVYDNNLILSEIYSWLDVKGKKKCLSLSKGGLATAIHAVYHEGIAPDDMMEKLARLRCPFERSPLYQSAVTRIRLAQPVIPVEIPFQALTAQYPNLRQVIFDLEDKSVVTGSCIITQSSGRWRDMWLTVKSATGDDKVDLGDILYDPRMGLRESTSPASFVLCGVEASDLTKRPFGLDRAGPQAEALQSIYGRLQCVSLDVSHMSVGKDVCPLLVSHLGNVKSITLHGLDERIPVSSILAHCPELVHAEIDHAGILDRPPCLGSHETNSDSCRPLRSLKIGVRIPDWEQAGFAPDTKIDVQIEQGKRSVVQSKQPCDSSCYRSLDRLILDCWFDDVEEDFCSPFEVARLLVCRLGTALDLKLLLGSDNYRKEEIWMRETNHIVQELRRLPNICLQPQKGWKCVT